MNKKNIIITNKSKISSLSNISIKHRSRKDLIYQTHYNNLKEEVEWY